MNYVNGIGYPVFTILDGATIIETISLPLTNEQGLIESYEERSISYEGLDFSESKDIKGHKINFKLYYNQYTSKETTQNIFKLLAYEKTDYTIILQPRSDVGARRFEVIGLNQGVNLGVLKQGAGHRLLELNYRTKNIVDDISPLDPDNLVLTFDYENLILI